MRNTELVEAVCAARFPEWDAMDPMTKKGARRQAEFWLETSEPLIRADERVAITDILSDQAQDAVDEVLTDLRAKVQAVQPYTHTHDHTDVVRRADVLALFDEAQK